MTAINSNVDVVKLAAALQGNRPIEGLVSDRIRGMVDQIAKERLSPNEYAQFKSMTTSRGAIKANRFAGTAAAYVDKKGAAAKRTAFVILALERSGRQELAASLLRKIFGEVAPDAIREQNFSPKGNE